MHGVSIRRRFCAADQWLCSISACVFLSCWLLAGTAIAGETRSSATAVAASSGLGNDATKAGPTVLPSELPLRRGDDNEPVTGKTGVAVVALLVLAVGAMLSMRLRKFASSNTHSASRRGAKDGWLSRLFKPAGDGAIRVLDSAVLTPHTRLHVVEWRGTEYFISSGHESIVVIDRRHAGTGEKDTANDGNDRPNPGLSQ